MIIRIKCDLNTGEAELTDKMADQLSELIEANPLLAADLLKDAVHYMQIWYLAAHATAFGYTIDDIEGSALQ